MTAPASWRAVGVTNGACRSHGCQVTMRVDRKLRSRCPTRRRRRLGAGLPESAPPAAGEGNLAARPARTGRASPACSTERRYRRGCSWTSPRRRRHLRRRAAAAATRPRATRSVARLFLRRPAAPAPRHRPPGSRHISPQSRTISHSICGPVPCGASPAPPRLFDDAAVCSQSIG